MKKLAFLLIALVTIAERSASAQQPPQTGGQSNPPAATAPQKSRPKRVHADLSGFELSPKPTTANSSVQVGGGTRGGLPKPVLYAPHSGKSYITMPTFYWDTSNAGKTFKLTVYDSGGNVVYDTTVQGDRFTYPASAPALKPGGTYTWTVQADGTIMAEPAEPVEFVLVSSEERSAIDYELKRIVGDSLDEQIKRAEIFVKARLWYDSIALYSALIDKYPDHSELYNRRGEIYNQIPTTQDLADKDFRRAEQVLQHTQPK